MVYPELTSLTCTLRYVRYVIAAHGTGLSSLKSEEVGSLFLNTAAAAASSTHATNFKAAHMNGIRTSNQGHDSSTLTKSAFDRVIRELVPGSTLSSREKEVDVEIYVYVYCTCMS